VIAQIHDPCIYDLVVFDEKLEQDLVAEDCKDVIECPVCERLCQLAAHVPGTRLDIDEVTKHVHRADDDVFVFDVDNDVAHGRMHAANTGETIFAAHGEAFDPGLFEGMLKSNLQLGWHRAFKIRRGRNGGYRSAENGRGLALARALALGIDAGAGM
jgi:hypothetical protein